MSSYSYPDASQLLNASNYQVWSETTQIRLQRNNLWDVVEPDCVQPSQFHDYAGHNAWTKKNNEALLAIQRSCGQETILQISGIKTAKEAWSALEAKFGPSVPIRTESQGSSQSNEKVEVIVHRHNEYFDYRKTYNSFVDCVSRRDLPKAVEFCKQYPELLKERIPNSRNTPQFFELIRIARNREEKVVEMLETAAFPTEALLELKNSTGDTSLTVAAKVGAIKIAKSIISIKPSLLLIPNNFGHIPVTVAVDTHFQEMIELLYRETERIPNDWLDNSMMYGATLITKSIEVGYLDIPTSLLQSNPGLISAKDFNGKSPLFALAVAPFLLRRNRRTSWRERFDQSIKWQRSMNSSDSASENFLVAMKTAITSQNVPVDDALFEAIKRGNVNMVAMLMRININFSKEVDDMLRNIYMCAIENRQSEIFNLIFCSNNHEKEKLRAHLYKDNRNNNLLHMAAKLAPPAALNCTSRPFLQMQRELQWYKEVEKLVPPSALTSKNLDHMTPAELFSVSHKDLREAGEKWMKKTSSAFAFLAPLFMVGMFAAGFQIPGGNDQNRGLPIFSGRICFKVYIMSVAMSVFSGTTSTFMFLQLLASNYSEEEFLKSLPNKMIIGLFTLWLSIATMIIAFCSGLYLSLDGESTILIPVMLLACVTIVLVILIQFPQLVEICSSTYWPTILGQGVDKS